MRRSCLTLSSLFLAFLVPLEGLLTSQFHNDDTQIEASPGSPFWEYLGCKEEPCYGSAEDWIFVSFGGAFVFENLKWYEQRVYRCLKQCVVLV